MEETKEELAIRAKVLFDKIIEENGENRKQLKQCFIDLLIFGKAEFVYKEEEE